MYIVSLVVDLWWLIYGFDMLLPGFYGFPAVIVYKGLCITAISHENTTICAGGGTHIYVQYRYVPQ